METASGAPFKQKPLVGYSDEDNQATFRQKLWKPQMLDMEQIVLHLIDAINLSALMVKDVGNASQANAVYAALVLNLDGFVYPLLTSDESINWDGYVEQRRKIIESWGKKSTDIGAPSDPARRLYTLTIRVLAYQRLFKTRRQVYFGIGWKKGQRKRGQKDAPPEHMIDNLQKLEELEGQTDTEISDDIAEETQIAEEAQIA